MIFEGLENPKTYEYDDGDDYSEERDDSFIDKED